MASKVFFTTLLDAAILQLLRTCKRQRGNLAPGTFHHSHATGHDTRTLEVEDLRICLARRVSSLTPQVDGLTIR